jgi:hypothetical protein
MLGPAPKPPALPASGTAPSSNGLIAPPVTRGSMDSLVAQAEPARENNKTAVEVRILTPQPDAADMKHRLFL